MQASLEELSKRMTEWRVNAPQQEKETTVVVQPQTELPPISISTNPTSSGNSIPSVGPAAAPAGGERSYPGGHLYVDLEVGRRDGAVDVSGVLAGFLRSLGVHPEFIPADLGERTALFEL